MVCSPAGTTIEAVRTLEELGFRSSIIEAMKSLRRDVQKLIINKIYEIIKISIWSRNYREVVVPAFCVVYSYLGRIVLE